MTGSKSPSCRTSSLMLAGRVTATSLDAGPAPLGSYLDGRRSSFPLIVWLSVGCRAGAVLVTGWLAAGCVVLGQDSVKSAPCLGEHLARLADLLICPGADDLRRGQMHLVDEPAHVVGGACGAGHGRPGSAELVGVLGHVRAAVLGEPVRSPSARGVLRSDQALVLELCQRRVYRPWAGLPEAAAALADLLDDLVAVHRLLGKQRERRCAHIAALGPAAAASPVAPGPWAELPRHAWAAWPSVESTPAEAWSELGPGGLWVKPTSPVPLSAPEPLVCVAVRVFSPPSSAVVLIHRVSPFF